jgi:hypothetical protein
MKAVPVYSDSGGSRADEHPSEADQQPHQHHDAYERVSV